MKLLLDENLSPALVRHLEAVYANSRHVDDVGLHGQGDDRIWTFAQANDYVLVSKDSDFRELSATRAPALKWRRVSDHGLPD